MCLLFTPAFYHCLMLFLVLCTCYRRFLFLQLHISLLYGSCSVASGNQLLSSRPSLHWYTYVVPAGGQTGGSLTAVSVENCVYYVGHSQV